LFYHIEKIILSLKEQIRLFWIFHGSFSLNFPFQNRKTTSFYGTNIKAEASSETRKIPFISNGNFQKSILRFFFRIIRVANKMNTREIVEKGNTKQTLMKKEGQQKFNSKDLRITFL